MTWLDRVRIPPDRQELIAWDRRFLSSVRAEQLTAVGWELSDLPADTQSLTRTTGDLAAVACVVIVAEPGSGKSVVIREDAIQRGDDGAMVHGYDCVEWQSEGQFLREFDDDGDMARFMRAPDERWLYLDGLDESSSVQSVLPVALSTALGGAHLAGLHIRITTRPIASLPSLVSRIGDRLGVDQVQLLPLNRGDLERVASERGADPAGFIAAIHGAGAWAIARRPLQAIWLLEEFRARGELQSTQTELYARHLEILCTERRETLLHAAGDGALGARDRLVIAGRIAALSAYSGRPTIAVDVEHGSREATLSLEDIGGGDEPAIDHSVRIDRDSVREVLGTALFTLFSPAIARWSHQSYRDFLAARWAAARLTPSQALALVTSGDPKRLVPQLYPIASWMAVTLPGFLEEVLAIEPELVLLGEALDAAQRDPFATVAALLKPEISQRIVDRRPLSHDVYRRVQHDGLADQLRPHLHWPTANENVLLLSTLIARACRTDGLDSELLALALDDAVTRSVRGAAIAALRDVGDGSSRKQLCQLLERDIDADMRGLAIEAVWPDQMTAAALFDALPDQEPEHIGPLGMFLSLRLVPGLNSEDLPTALRWCRRIERPHHLGMNHEEAIRKIVDLASEQLADEPTRAELFDVLRNRWTTAWPRQMPAELGARLGENAQARRELLELIFADERPISVAMGILHLGRGAVDVSDIGWLRARMEGTSDDSQSAAAFMLRTIGEWYAAYDDLYALRGQLAALDKQLDFLFDAVAITGKPVGGRNEPAPSPAEKLTTQATALQHALAVVGEPSRWRAIVAAFEVGHHHDIPSGAMMATPLGATLTPAERALAVTSAVTFLDNVALPNGWYETNQIPWDVIYGQAAMQLLQEADKSALLTTNAGACMNWAPAALAAIASTREEVEAASDVCATLYECQPDVVRDAAVNAARAEAKVMGRINVLSRLSGCDDAPMVAAVLTLVDSPELGPAALGDLLTWATAKEGDAVLRCRALIEAREGAAPARERAIAAARALLGTSDAGWEILFPIFQGDEEFGRSVVRGAEQDVMAPDLGLGGKLSPQELVEFYDWMRTAFVEASEDDGRRGRVFSYDKSMAFLKSAVLEAVILRGTDAACDALRGAQERHPDERWWTTVLERAEAVRRNTGWAGTSPEELRRLAGANERSLVRDGAELLGLVEKALLRIAGRLRGELPMARLLWNETRTEAGVDRRPKDENTLSDFLAVMLDIELRERGVVINREVQIRRGQETDIRVEAIRETHRAGVFDSISVTVEVKGCWHRDVSDALKTQLVDRYLNVTECRHGLYLVGWYDCPEWNAADYRRGGCASGEGEMMDALVAQAQEASTGDLLVHAMGIDVRWPVS